MQYKSFEDLANTVRRNIWKVPHDVGVVVGIPRSGMIPALMIAEFLNKPCADVDSFSSGCVMSHGVRGDVMDCCSREKVLVVDDSVFSGRSILKAKECLSQLKEDFDFIYCGIYVESPEARDAVDIFFEDLWNPSDRSQRKEWNILHLYERDTLASMWDIDGLICKDPPDDRNKEEYESYLPVGLPMIIPTNTIGALVTYRLEVYREQTRVWLRDNGVWYKELIMFPAETREQRNSTEGSAHYKARLYKAAKWAKLFVESSASEAERIHSMSGKPVFCYENGILYQ